MGPDLTPAAPVTSCPACRAAVRDDAEWCSLCYTVLRAPAAVAAPVFEPGETALPVAAAPAVQARHAAPDPLTAPLVDVLLPPPAEVAAAPAYPLAEAPAAEPVWPCTSCGAVNPLEAPVCGTCGSGFLAAASSRPKLVLPVVGDVGALSRGQRIGAALAVVAMVLVPVALVTMLLSGGAGTGSAGQDPSKVTEVAP